VKIDIKHTKPKGDKEKSRNGGKIKSELSPNLNLNLKNCIPAKGPTSYLEACIPAKGMAPFFRDETKA